VKLGILVSGGGTNLQAIIDAIEDGTLADCEIVTVVSSKPDAYALERAAKHNIPAKVIARKEFADLDKFDAAIAEHMLACKVDLIVTAGFLSILGSETIAAFPNKIINVHPALIPAFCGKGFYGLRVHEAVLQSGVKTTGATVHYVNEIVDGGEIILQKEIDVLPDDTPETLQRRVMEQCERVILVEAVKQFIIHNA